MNLEWWQLLLGFVGTSGISIYCAKPKKSSMEIDNLKKIIDEAQDEREHMKELYSLYEEKTDNKIKELEDKLKEMDEKYNIVLKASNMAYRCPLPQSIKECPVIKALDTECPNIDC